jgi:hypothetical protein
MEPNVAFMTAPIPMDDCAEMDTTAIPMKYESGITLSNESRKISSREQMHAHPNPRTYTYDWWDAAVWTQRVGEVATRNSSSGFVAVPSDTYIGIGSIKTGKRLDYSP